MPEPQNLDINQDVQPSNHDVSHIKTGENMDDDDDEEVEEENIMIIKDKLSLLRKSLVFKKNTMQIPANDNNEDVNRNRNQCNEQQSPAHAIQQSCIEQSIQKRSGSDSNDDLLPLKSLLFPQSTPPKTPIKKVAEVEEYHLGGFATQKHKDAFFDPLVSPPINTQQPQQTDDANENSKITEINQENHINYNQPIHHENATKIQKQWKKFQFKTILVNTFNRHLKQSKQNNVTYLHVHYFVIPIFIYTTLLCHML